MNRELARKIFECWQGYMETADRFHQLMITPPPSFLPYPIEILEEALNIVAKEYSDAGDRKRASDIQEMMLTQLASYHLKTNGADGLGYTDLPMTDEEALKQMQRTLDLILGDPSLKDVILKNLKKSQESWMEFRSKQ